MPRMVRSLSATSGLLLLFGVLLAPAHASTPTPPNVRLQDLAIDVAPDENRAVSFTNKASAYYYTQTHRNDHVEHAWFRGFNIAGRRIFNDYRLLVDGVALDPAAAKVTVRPDALIRRYPGGITETVRLFDSRDLVQVSVQGAVGNTALRLFGDRLQAQGHTEGVDWYLSSEEGQTVADHVAVVRNQDGFLIAVGPSRDAANQLLAESDAHRADWQDRRVARLEGLINGAHAFDTDDARLTEALRWITLTTDELVTRQRGDGIYAGLPWFNEYWGRDSFISLPGALLVTGQFDTAREVLSSFAQFQQMDPALEFYGRVPNIVKPGSIDYHTTDGTPRFIVALRDYVRYSGDQTLVKALYPNIAASIDGALAHWTDASGYLLHKDNETWMDARREPDKASYSPRSTRANDIQWLWHQQLEAGVQFARAMGDTQAAARWQQAAERVRMNFERDYLDATSNRLADHLAADGTQDFTLRPNLFFALDMIADTQASARTLRKAWEGLVYPWGTSTLEQGDPRFHPYHLAPGQYHKDAAYHNGTVWPWLNGIAMQRMIENGQVELAWPLFQRMNAYALERGVVGGLAETMDAYPHPGEAEPRLTGTFLQAWSNAEQLRVWYQYILGIQPDMLDNMVVLAPRLPDALGAVEFSVNVGKGTLAGKFDHVDGNRRYVYRLDQQDATLQLDVSPFPVRAFRAVAGDTLEVVVDADVLHARLFAADGRERDNATLPASAERRADQARLDAIFDGTKSAAPLPLDSHPAMRANDT
jgi:glycogen debranching enzyme